MFWNDALRRRVRPDHVHARRPAQPRPSPGRASKSCMTTQDFAPEGEKMYKNMGRFNDPKAPGYIARIDELLATIPTHEGRSRAGQGLPRAERPLHAAAADDSARVSPGQFYEFIDPALDRTSRPPRTRTCRRRSPASAWARSMLWSLKPVPQTVASSPMLKITPRSSTSSAAPAGTSSPSWSRSRSTSFCRAWVSANPVDTIMAKVSAGMDTKTRQRQRRSVPQGVRAGRGRRPRQGRARRGRQAGQDLARCRQFVQLPGHEPARRPRQLDLAVSEARERNHQDRAALDARAAAADHRLRLDHRQRAGRAGGLQARRVRQIAVSAGAADERDPRVLLRHAAGVRASASSSSGSPPSAATTTV